MKTSMRAGNGVLILALLFLAAALFSDFLSPSHPEEQNLNQFFCPPTRIHLWDNQGNFHWRPFVNRFQIEDPLEVKYKELPGDKLPLHFFSRGYSYRFLGLIPASLHLVTCPDGGLHILGTDELGRDVLSRLLAGTKTSLLVVLLGLLICSVLGLAAGGVAGLRGGWLDGVLMRFSEFVLALPALYVILALRAALPLKMPYWQTLLLTVGTIACIAWPPMARAVRGLILQLRGSRYIEAARALGATPIHIVRRHYIPALLPYIISQAIVTAPVFLLGEIVLSFLDVGFREDGGSWGMMLRNIRDPRILTTFWWNLTPLGMVVLTLYLLNALSGNSSEGPGEHGSMRM